MKIDVSKLREQAHKSSLKEERLVANKAWETSSATLFADPAYAGDRRNVKRGSKFKLTTDLLVREKTERLRALRLGQTVVELPVPIEEPVIEQPSLGDHLQRIREIRKSSDRVRGTQSGILEGFVYVVVNPAWPDWVKVGQTVDFESRLRSYQTASPNTDYLMVMIRHVSDSLFWETKILEAAGKQFQVKGEWVKCSVADIEQLYADMMYWLPGTLPTFS